MTVLEEIDAFLTSQSEPKQSELTGLHQFILSVEPTCQLCFSDGTNDAGKVVSNPTIGYGIRTIKYANGKTKESFRIGLSANNTGISVYILGIEDKTYLATTYGKDLGKASVTGYCIKFRSLKDINVGILEEAIQFGLSKNITE